MEVFMSVGIVRVQKYTKGGVKGEEIHDLREKEGISHTNKNIDWSRTKYNYPLALKTKNYHTAIKEKIDSLELQKAVRKDAVVMVQVLVTSDHEFFKDLTREQQNNFFKDSFDFLSERYGEKNVISAVIHLDEETPHMHFNFVPITEDGRLCAKEILSRGKLIDQQDKFAEYVGKKYGLERGMTKEQRILAGTDRKALTMREYKTTTTYISQGKEELKNLDDEKAKRLKELNDIAEAQKQAQEQILRNSVINAEYEGKKAYIADCNEICQTGVELPDYAKVTEKGLLKKEEFVTVPKEKWLAHHVSFQEKKALADLRKEIDYNMPTKVLNRIERENVDLKEENKNLKSENASLGVELKKANQFIKRVNQTMDTLPLDIKNAFKAVFNALGTKKEKTAERDNGIEH